MEIKRKNRHLKNMTFIDEACSRIEKKGVINLLVYAGARIVTGGKAYSKHAATNAQAKQTEAPERNGRLPAGTLCR